MIKKLVRWILRQELSEKDDEIKQSTTERDWFISELAKVSDERNRYKERLASSINYVLPNGVVSKVISLLPNPNELRKYLHGDGKEYIITGNPADVRDPNDRWYFSVKFEKLVKVSDVKILMVVTLKNNLGYAKLEIPATVANLKLDKSEYNSWVWNFYEAGIAMVPDDLYGVMQRSKDAWNNVLYELGL